jgi:hypothetical protein
METHHPLEQAVIDTLRYFSCFSHPLLVTEIQVFAGIACTEQEVQGCLNRLVHLGEVQVFNDYYGLADIRTNVVARLEARSKLETFEGRIRRSARIISWFPFVSFVGLSGSLSKGIAPRGADIDFFIVTSTNRLWIARTLLHVFKKLTFVVNRQHDFCMNYFVDESALQIEEQNRFTATELATLVPLYSVADCYERFYAHNTWSRCYLPNYEKSPAFRSSEKNLIRRGAEWLLNGLAPEGLNRWLMRTTDQKWQRKWRSKGYPAADYDLAFKTRPNVSKNHFKNTQKKILNHLEANRPYTEVAAVSQVAC